MSTTKDPLTDVALEVLEHGLTKLPCTPEYRHAKSGLFTEQEARQFDDIVAMVASYLERTAPPRPLCIAVFGAPGSGKSRLVKQLPERIGEAGAALAKLAEINVTQVTSVDHLAGALLRAQLDAGDRVPFVFFDEFDAKLDGAPWGWLSWFLAPMQDGAYRRGSDGTELKRAVYVFAGGTASSFDAFGRADRAGFAFAKGPDFVSRLRGYVDIRGVNGDGDERGVRRAAVLNYQLAANQRSVDDALKTALLQVGRYKHGARSMEALVELMPAKTLVTIDHLKAQPLLGMHVDRGTLDPRTIGGEIWLSGSDALSGQFVGGWNAICLALFRDGARIACGGRISPEGLTHRLEEVVKDLPERLEPGDAEWIVLSRGVGAPGIDRRVKVLHPPPLQPEQLPARLRDTLQGQSLKEPIELFRMRHQMALRAVAQVAIGGRLLAREDGRSRRYPGVAEELMLALALKRPVYVSGVAGGAARWAGDLLGLGREWVGVPGGFDEDIITVPEDTVSLFRPPPLLDLPLDRADLVDFFQRRALGGSGWVDNGLSPEENRQLFEATAAEEIAGFIRCGLQALFARESR